MLHIIFGLYYGFSLGLAGYVIWTDKYKIFWNYSDQQDIEQCNDHSSKN